MKMKIIKSRAWHGHKLVMIKYKHKHELVLITHFGDGFEKMFFVNFYLSNRAFKMPKKNKVYVKRKAMNSRLWGRLGKFKRIDFLRKLKKVEHK